MKTKILLLMLSLLINYSSYSQKIVDVQIISTVMTAILVFEIVTGMLEEIYKRDKATKDWLNNHA